VGGLNNKLQIVIYGEQVGHTRKGNAPLQLMAFQPFFDNVLFSLSLHCSAVDTGLELSFTDILIFSPNAIGCACLGFFAVRRHPPAALRLYEATILSLWTH
jgi:hypothetical protein